jgi:hypothetical protein
MKFVRRLGPDPHAGGAQSAACSGCPDIWELEDGDFAIIGITITLEAKRNLPDTAGCGLDESIVRIPRGVLLAARSDIPDWGE